MHAQVIKESMRMFPVSASGLGRCTKEPTVLGGYLIPAGCEIQVSQADLRCARLLGFACHPALLACSLFYEAPARSTRYLAELRPCFVAAQINYYAMQNTAANFEGPQRFWPERWLRNSGPGAMPEQSEDDVDKLSHNRDPLARAFLPYSAGPRSCIGQPLAMMEVNGCNCLSSWLT